MALKKKYSKDKSRCKVTFILPSEVAKEFNHIALVGNFNNWDTKSHRFLPRRNKTYSISVELEPNKEYEFKYLADETTWLNEEEADKNIVSPIGSTNSVIVL